MKTRQVSRGKRDSRGCGEVERPVEGLEELGRLRPGMWKMLRLKPANEHWIIMNVDIIMLMNPARGNLFLVFYVFSLVC